MTQYRLTRYTDKCWQLEELMHNKKKDTYDWRAIKWPGTINHAVKSMVDKGFGDFSTDSAQAILDKLDSIEQRLLDTLTEFDGVEFEGE